MSYLVGFFPREKTSQMNIKVPYVLTLDNVHGVSVCALCLTQQPSLVKVEELQSQIKQTAVLVSFTFLYVPEEHHMA